MADHVGQRFGQYQLIRKLGSGGFADVYLGRHIHLDSDAAIKVIHNDNNQLSDADKQLFRTEGRTLVRLIHPHIVRLLDFNIENNIPYLVMDYAPNGSLREKHPHGTRLPLTTIVAYIKQAAEALQYAHDQKLIHRDVKPDNMLLGHNNEIVLSDFGIAVVAHSTKSMRIEDIIGTSYYMAPEQLSGQPRTASDQYSLGVITYSWLTGIFPFTGTYVEIVSQQLTKLPPPLRNTVPNLPVEVERVVLKALEKDPQQRYETIRAFALALEQASQKWIAPTVRANLPVQNQPGQYPPQNVVPAAPLSPPGGDFLQAQQAIPSGQLVLRNQTKQVNYPIMAQYPQASATSRSPLFASIIIGTYQEVIPTEFYARMCLVFPHFLPYWLNHLESKLISSKRRSLAFEIDTMHKIQQEFVQQNAKQAGTHSKLIGTYLIDDVLIREGLKQSAQQKNFNAGLFNVDQYLPGRLKEFSKFTGIDHYQQLCNHPLYTEQGLREALQKLILRDLFIRDMDNHKNDLEKWLNAERRKAKIEYVH